MFRWHQPDIPRKGWSYLGCTDHGEGNFVTCEMCLNPGVRFEHHVANPDWPVPLSVGCDCAEHMTQDYASPKAEERDVKNRSKRLKSHREKWLSSGWRTTTKGNFFHKKTRVTIFRAWNGWKYVYQDQFYGAFPSTDAAKAAAYERHIKQYAV